MGLFDKSSQVVRFRVGGLFAGTMGIDEMAERIRKFSFRPIGQGDEKSFGTTFVCDMLIPADRAPFLAVDEHMLVFGIRFDCRKVASAALKLACATEEERVRTEKQVPRLSRSHRQDIAKGVKLKLMSMAPPVPLFWQVAYDLAAEEVLVFSGSRQALEMTETAFRKIFDITITRDIVATLADRERKSLSGRIVGMDLVDAMAATSTLSRQWLTWIWYMAANDMQIAGMEVHGPAEVVIVCPDAKTTCKGDQRLLPEAIAGLRDGKLADRATFSFCNTFGNTVLTISSTDLKYTITPPKMIAGEDDEVDQIGTTYERIKAYQHSVEVVERTIAEFAASFIDDDGESRWPTAAHTAWMNGEDQ